MILCVLLVLANCLVAECQTLAPLSNAHMETVIAEEYLVILKPGSVGLKSTTEATILKIFKIGDFRCLFVKADGAQLMTLRKDPNVDAVEANGSNFHIMCTSQKTGARLWGLSRMSFVDHPDYTKATFNHDDHDNGEGVKAYILDTGIYLDHNDFGGRASFGFLADDLDGGSEEDLSGHGTHCAGTVGGTEYGVAKNVELIAVKVLNGSGGGTTAGIASGLVWIAQQHLPGDKSVVNMSLGSRGYSESINRAVDALVNAGVVVVTSAGNSNHDACEFTPALMESVITVAASTNTDEIATFSNFGSCVNIVAPGVNILSADIGDPDGSTHKNGTSMACPHVVGWAARYMSAQESTPSPKEVLQTMLNTGSWNKLSMPEYKENTPNVLPFTSC